MRATGSIQNIMETTLETIKGSIDANTIIGDPIKTDTTVVVPISKVTIGFGIGAGEYSKGYKEEVNTDKRSVGVSSRLYPRIFFVFQRPARRERMISAHSWKST